MGRSCRDGGKGGQLYDPISRMLCEHMDFVKDLIDSQPYTKDRWIQILHVVRNGFL